MTAPQFTKKGQVEMNEMILVLFFIIILIAAGIFVYYRYSVQSIERAGEELEEQEASVLLTSVSHLGEIMCEKQNCVDTSKLLPFALVTQENPAYYSTLFGTKTIRVIRTYPIPKEHVICTPALYNQESYPRSCATYVIYSNKPPKPTRKIIISTPISMYYPELNSYYIGRLEIEVY